MSEAKRGDTVKVHYTGTLEDGTQFDSSRGGEPLEFTLGAGSLIPGFENLSFDEWFDVKVFGKPLWEFGFWNLLYRVLSPEAYAFMQDGLGYDTNVANGNAVNMLITTPMASV